MISWQEIITRLLFASILGSATAIDKKWYRTKQFMQSATLISLGAAMFALLINSTSRTQFSADLIIGISIVCLGVSWQQQIDGQGIGMDTIVKLWFAGAVGSMVGYGFFVPAYLGILIVILNNLLFTTPAKKFVSEVESDRDLESEPAPEQLAAVARKHCYRCNIHCLVEDEAEVLASLIQLSNEQNLTPTKIRSKNLSDRGSTPEIEIQVDFVTNSIGSTLPLQQVMMSLKRKLNIISASWIDLPPEQGDKNSQMAPKSD